jgi:hypothetical protein
MNQANGKNQAESLSMATTGTIMIPRCFSDMEYNPIFADDVTKKQESCYYARKVLEHIRTKNDDMQKTANELVKIHKSNRDYLTRVYRDLIDNLLQNDESLISHKRSLEKYEDLVENFEKCEIFVLKQIVGFLKSCDKAYLKLNTSDFHSSYKVLSANAEAYIDYPHLAYILGADGFSDTATLVRNLEFGTPSVTSTDANTTVPQKIEQYSKGPQLSLVDKIKFLISIATALAKKENKKSGSTTYHPVRLVNAVLYNVVNQQMKDNRITYSSKSTVGISELMNTWREKMIDPHQDLSFKLMADDLLKVYNSLERKDADESNKSLVELNSWFVDFVVEVLKKLHGKIHQKKVAKKQKEDQSSDASDEVRLPNAKKRKRNGKKDASNENHSDVNSENE